MDLKTYNIRKGDREGTEKYTKSSTIFTVNKTSHQTPRKCTKKSREN